MGPDAAALARHRSYALFSRLFLEGVTTELVPYLKQVAQLVQQLPQPFDADDAAASHYHVFGVNVLAYEGVFLSAQPATAQVVEQRYQQCGYPFVANDLSSDHIGHELGHMAFLCGAEVGAWQARLPTVVHQMQMHQRAFMQDHLLRWLPALTEAIRSQDDSFYSLMAGLVQDIVHDHAAGLLPGTSPPKFLPQPPPLLKERSTRLQDIAAYLADPAISGIYLSRNDMAALARSCRLPSGFGTRQQLLENLLRAAAQYDAMSELLATIDAVAVGWERSYRSAFAPPLDAFTRPWRRNVSATRALLKELGTAAQNVDD